MGFFSPAAGGRMVANMDGHSTALLAAMHRGKNNPNKAYVLITPEGTLRQTGDKTVKTWEEAVKIALEEGIFIYNVRSKKCSRPVWICKPEDRTPMNMTFEEVKLIPDEKTYFDTLPLARAKIFHIDF